jgi:DUF4097 and DUF4098 domain-containing protein YvlB
MDLTTIALACALTAQAQPPAEPRQTRAPQTDQTVSVSRGARLAIDNYAGEVVIRVWDKDAVRVQARHNSRTKVDIHADANAVTVGTATAVKSSGSIDYDITVPAWMPLKIEGHYDFVTVEGVQSEISVTTVRGDIVLKNIGSVIAKTIEGAIEVDGARGKTALSSVNEDIKIAGVSGDLSADTTNGSIALARIESTNVEVATVNGDITYEGQLPAKAHLSFSTHGGDITLTVPDSANATFNVRTYSGEFGASVPVKGPDASSVRRGKRVTYTLGNGSAEVELESFGGDIRLRRAGPSRSGRK